MRGLDWRRRVWRLLAAAAAAGAVLVTALTGCGLSIPTDPDGTMQRVRDEGVLRAAASIDPPLVVHGSPDPTGPLVDLVERFAGRLGAEVTWTVTSEESMVVALEEGEVDLGVGGMTRDTTWAERVGITRGYRSIPGAAGREIVLFVPLGENALLTELEHFLDEEAGP